MGLQKRVNYAWQALKNKAKIAGAMLATAGSTLLPSMAVAQVKQPVEQTAKAPEYVSGQVMVQFKSDPFELSPELAKSRKSPYSPISTTQLFDASVEPNQENQFQIRDVSLESVMREFKVSSVQPLTPGAKGERMNTYLLKFDPFTNVEQIVSSLTKLGLVRKAHPDMIRKALISPPTPRTEEYHHENTGQWIPSQFGTPGEDLRTRPAWQRVADAYNNGNTCISYLAIIDTGADVTNPNLVGRIDTTLSYNFVDMNTDITDTNGHGTTMAKVAAGSGPDGNAVAWLPNIKVITYKVSNDGTFTSSRVVMALNEIALKRGLGVNITSVNSSFGGLGISTGEADAYRDVDVAGANLIMGGGNADANELFYPCAYWMTDGRFFNFCVTGLDNRGVRQKLTRGGHINIATYSPVWALGAFVPATSPASAEQSSAVALARSINPTLTKDDIYTLMFANLRTPPASPGCDELSLTGCSVPNLDATTDAGTRPPYCATVPGASTVPLVGAGGIDVCAGELVEATVSPNSRAGACGSPVMRETLPGSVIPSAWHLISPVAFVASVGGNLRLETAYSYEQPACYMPVDIPVTVRSDTVHGPIGNNVYLTKDPSGVRLRWDSVGAVRDRVKYCTNRDLTGPTIDVDVLETLGTTETIISGAPDNTYFQVRSLSDCTNTESP